MTKISASNVGIRPQTSRLQPPGKHVFLAKQPSYLQELLEYPYAEMVTFRGKRPTGGSSWNPMVRRAHDKRFCKHAPQFLEAVRCLERKLNAWKETSAHSAQLLIAQAEDLLWYMSKEIALRELTTLYEIEESITSETDYGQLWLLNLSLDVREYINRLTEEISQETSEAHAFVLDVQRVSATFLLQRITQRFGYMH